MARFATDGTNPDFKMDVPHLFYDMNADGSYNYANKSASQFYTKRSWEAGTAVTIGQAFFTQTAIIGTEEELTFKLPQYTGETTAPDAASRQLISLTDDNGYGDVMEVMPKEDADPAMPYRVGSDGVKWFAFSDVAPQFYLLNADGTPLSLESAAPLETELPVGLRKGQSGQLTVALPQPEAFADYSHVWLTDHKEGTVTDLLETSYSFAQHEDAYDEQRLTLRFGGARPVMPDEQQSSGLVIYSSRQHIIIKGLQEGDLIDIYNAGGAQRERCRATSSDYRRRFYDGIYIVRVISAANGQRTVKKLEVR